MSFDASSPEELARRLERFVDNLPGLAYRCEPQAPWEMAFIRGRVEALTGYPPGAFEEGDVTYGELVVDEDVEGLDGTIGDAVAEREQFTATYRIETRDGIEKHVFERGGPVVEDGMVTALEGIVVDVTERKRYERELKRQNVLFEQTQRLANVGGWAYDVAADELRWTDQVNRIHGVPMDASPSPEEADEFYHPDDRPVIREAVAAAIQDGEAFDHELRIRTGHGEQRWVRVRGVPRFEDDKVVRVAGAVQDVTDRHEREEALREEQAFTSSILAALPDVLYAFDEDGSMTRWNDELLRVTGYDDDEVAEMTVPDFVAESDRERVLDHVGRVLEDAESTTVEADVLTSEGERVPYEFTGAPLRDDNGAVVGVVGIGRDVSAREERERRFEAVFNNTYQFTGLMEPDGTLLEVNATGLTFTGWDPEDAAGTKLWESPVFAREATEAAIREGVERAADGEFYRTELPLVGEDRDATIDFSIRPITDDDGTVHLLVPEGRDISKLKERERLLRLLHRLLRHNLRNDLNTIRGYAEILEEACEDDLQRYAGQVRSAAADLAGMSETSRDFITLALDFEEPAVPIDLGRLVETVGERMRHEHPDASVTVTVDDEVHLDGDTRLEYLFTELLKNAVEHADSDHPRVDVTVARDGEEAVVTVADNGPGIPAHEWATVVEEGAVERSQLDHGSGVGLLLANWVADRYGGGLSYVERDTGGSRVTVRLPCA